MDRLVEASGQAKYWVSADGNWCIESIWYAADMCALQNRFVFNLWNGLQLGEADMQPWLTLDGPCAAESTAASRPKQQTDMSNARQLEVDDSAYTQQFEKKKGGFPNLQFNIGCHDDYSDEEDYPDYHSGCERVTFCECPLQKPRGLRTKVQALRASRYSNTWDRTGRHWLYVLPPSPTEPVVKECLSRVLPLHLMQRVWAYADSWPCTELPEYSCPNEATR